VGGFQVLFDANANVLSDPNLIEVGDVLQIPCANGSLPTRSAVQTTQGPTPTTSTPDRAIRIVTATGYAPFTDEGMEGGGIITQMVNRALELGNPPIARRCRTSQSQARIAATSSTIRTLSMRRLLDTTRSMAADLPPLIAIPIFWGPGFAARRHGLPSILRAKH